MNVKSNESAKVIDHPAKESTPVDYAISIHMQNLYATYGEDKVKASLKELFGMESKKKKAS